MASPPLHRFEEYGSLTASERQAVLSMADIPYNVEKGCAIQGEGAEVTGFFILFEGWAAAASSLPDGGRQILKIHLAGDALGTPSMALKRTTEEVFALTNVTVAHVSFAQFGKVFQDHPRVAARFMLSIQFERVTLMDRLVSIGRTSGEARVAAFLLDLMDRLRPLGLVERSSFYMPATQEQIGDVLSLTGVHVNRVLAGLTSASLIERSGKRVRLIDVETLAELAARPTRIPFANQSWLPPAR